jgi:hypothetical protein
MAKLMPSIAAMGRVVGKFQCEGRIVFSQAGSVVRWRQLLVAAMICEAVSLESEEISR